MSLRGRIVVVDDEPGQRELLSGFLEDLGAEVSEAADGREALGLVERTLPDVVLTDFRMPGMDGGSLLREVKARNPEVEVVIVTAFGTVRDAVGCLKDGAFDYLLKPLELDEVELTVQRALERRHLIRENRELKTRLGRVESVPGIVTAGGAMADALSTVARVAPSPVSVLLLGESGTGKELIARAIHAGSPRSEGPFVAVNAAALSASLLESELFGHERGAFTGAEKSRIGRFEAASGGTLFLDEIGDLPGEIQVKLLRALQEHTIERVGSTAVVEVDVRIIAATHRDLPTEVREGRFRDDLYYRLAVVTIDIPPLRARRADVPLLVEHFVEKHAASGIPAKAFSREAMDLLVRYGWPGNVRELENVVQRALVLARGDTVLADDLPGSVRSADAASASPGTAGDPLRRGTLPERVAALEREAIHEALESEGGNQCRAADRLCISERALRYKLRKIRADD